MRKYFSLNSNVKALFPAVCKRDAYHHVSAAGIGSAAGVTKPRYHWGGRPGSDAGTIPEDALDFIPSGSAPVVAKFIPCYFVSFHRELFLCRDEWEEVQGLVGCGHGRTICHAGLQCYPLRRKHRIWGEQGDGIDHIYVASIPWGEKIEPWVRMPLAAINVFEVLYWVVMALLVGGLCGTRFGKSFKFVMSTYGVGYLFYIAFLMFLMLYLT